jgi:hypothetical protein
MPLPPAEEIVRAVELTVEPKPEDWNPAHAEIPQHITRGLANKIVSELQLHRPPGTTRSQLCGDARS